MLVAKLSRVIPWGVACLMYLRMQRFLSKSSTSSGVTLIELMVALFVFAIGMLAVTAMCLMSIHGNSLVNRMTQANFLAQSKMEELLSERDMAALVVGNYSDATPLDGNGDPGGSYTRSWVLTADADTRWITVNVGWADSKGSHQVELKSLARGQ